MLTPSIKSGFFCTICVLPHDCLFVWSLRMRMLLRQFMKSQTLLKISFEIRGFICVPGYTDVSSEFDFICLLSHS